MIKLSGHTIDPSLVPAYPIAVDVGSRNYGFSGDFLNLFPTGHVFAIEPDPKVPAPTDSRIHLIRAALVHDGRKEAEYESYSTGEGNFVVDIGVRGFNPHVYDAEIIKVPCVGIPEVLDIIASICLPRVPPRIDVLKLDCEGAEFGLLETMTYPVAKQISVEFHDWQRQEHYTKQYYADLFAKLPFYTVALHQLSAVGSQNEAWGHWDSLLIANT